MYGAIIGDIVGSKYEFNNIKTKDFPLFSTGCDYTDDTIMTVAVAKAIMTGYEKYHGINGKEKEFETLFIQAMQDFGRRYPYPKGAYGARFSAWIRQQDPEPYNSYGNGSAMRASPCGLFAADLEEATTLARLSAAVSHDHPEGIKGAQAVAAAVFLAKAGKTKDEIRRYLSEKYYDLDFTLDEIRETYAFEASCQKSVPQAIMAFLESESFEDAIRNVISIGGDCDTTGAITGSIAWTYYTMGNGGYAGGAEDVTDPAMLAIRDQAKAYLPEEFIALEAAFRKLCLRRAAAFHRFKDNDVFLHDDELYAKLTGKAPAAPEENKKAGTDVRKQTVCSFQDITVDMDHDLSCPAVHAKCGTGDIVVDYAGYVRRNSGFPRDKEALLIGWVRTHRAEICNNHRRVNEGKEPLEIEPWEPITKMIATERLIIRVASDREMEKLIAATADPDLAKAYREMLDGSRLHPDTREWYAIWMIETKDGKHVGDLSFKGLQPDGSAEIGYGIDTAHRNRGCATEAVKAAALWALRQPGCARVEAETEPDNRASRRVLEKCGFVPTGTCGEEGPRFVKTN